MPQDKEIMLLNNMADRFETMIMKMFKLAQEENAAQRQFFLELVKAGADSVTAGAALRDTKKVVNIHKP